MHLNIKLHSKCNNFKSLQASFSACCFLNPIVFISAQPILAVSSEKPDYILCGQNISSGLGKGHIPCRSEPVPYGISLQLQSGQSNWRGIGGTSQFHQSHVTTYSSNQTGAALTLFRMSRTQDPSATWSGLIGLCVAEEKMDEELLVVAPAIFVASRQGWICSPCLAERDIFIFFCSWLVKYILELPRHLKWKPNLLEAKPKEQLRLSFWMLSVTVTVMWEEAEFTFNNIHLHKCDCLSLDCIVLLMFFHTAVYLQTWVDVDIDIDKARGMRPELD